MTIPEHIWLPIVGVVSVIAALAFWWWWPRWQVNRLALEIRDPKARADAEDMFRKTVGQLLGGAAVLFGAWLAFLQFSQQQQTAQSQIKQQQQAAQQQQQQAARELLISNQVSKGFEQLASDKMAMRLGGIYALEGVMNASERPEQYRGPVLEMLCAFVREYTIGKTVFEKPDIDIQAALTVIGRRPRADRGQAAVAPYIQGRFDEQRRPGHRERVCGREAGFMQRRPGRGRRRRQGSSDVASEWRNHGFRTDERRSVLWSGR
jgi:hypothetical protein